MRGTSLSPTTVELITSGERKLEIDRELTPKQTKVGDVLGVWIGNSISDESGGNEHLGSLSVTAVRKLR